MPFPGNYPTRWLIEGSMRRQRIMESEPRYPARQVFYFGKPNYRVARWLLDTARNHSGQLFVREFDRGGLIRSGFKHLPTVRWAVDYSATYLVGLYYPMSSRHMDILGGWQEAFWNTRKVLKWEDHRVTVYSHGTWSLSTRLEVSEWVKNTKFQWK